MPLPTDPEDIIPPDDFPDTENETAPGDLVATFERTGNTVIRSYKVPWDNYFVHVENFLGFSAMNGTNLDRQLPYRDFQHREMIAQRVEVRGLGYRGADLGDQGPLTSANRYQWAKLTVMFGTFPFKLGDEDPDTGLIGIGFEGAGGDILDPPSYETQRYCFKEVRPGKEYITAKPGGLCWANDDGSDGDAINFPLPALQSFEDITVTWYDLPRDCFPDTAIQKCEGRVNSVDLVLPAFPPPQVYEAETIFLQTHSTKLTYFPNGLESCDLTFYFKRRSNPIEGSATRAGFNHFLRQDGNYKRLKRKGSGTPGKGLFDKDDFNELFIPQLISPMIP